MDKSCSIFFYDGWLGAAPTVINLATTLANLGYAIIIYNGKRVDYSHPNNLNEQIKIVDIEKPKFINNLNHILFHVIKLGSITHVINLIVFGIQILFWNFKQGKQYLSPEISIGVDTNGSIIAWIESCIFKSQLVYLSLELTLKNQFGKFDIRQFLEHIAFRNSSCLLIQDEDRFEHLCNQNNYKHQQVFYLPNSVNSYVIESTNNYFREKFKLNKEEYPYLITHAGMLSHAVFAEEVVTAFNNIDNGYALIYHESRKRDWDEPYFQLLRKINSKNLFLSLDPLPYEEIHRVFDGSSIGLVIYKEIDDNFGKIAKASGKLSGYLQYGKPVIMNNLLSLVELNNKYNFGRVVQDISCSTEIESALQDILANYDTYSKNAKYCFEKEFTFDTKVEPFLKFLYSESLSSSLSN
jgi:hypothetical protein